MSKLTDYAKTADFMNVSLEIDGKPYKFNLDLQLAIIETKLSTQIKEQPRAYAFLCMLRNKVKIEYKKAVKELDRHKNSLYHAEVAKDAKAKVTNVKNAVAVNKQVIAMENKIEELENLRSVLDICVTSFEQRKDLLQTLSSNLRQESKN